MSTIAADLNLSTRTLARRLAEEGTSFREIDDAARCARAEKLLRETITPVESVASAAGYATNSPFVRAFKRWHAMPPACGAVAPADSSYSRRMSGFHCTSGMAATCTPGPAATTIGIG
jgi:AraC-like DNA-binding protein